LRWRGGATSFPVEGGLLFVEIRAELLIAPGTEENISVPLKNFPPQPKQQARFIAKKAREDRVEN